MATGFPPRPVPGSWPATRLPNDEVVVLLTSPPVVAGKAGTQRQRAVGVELLLEWLRARPGETWQQRWLSAEPEVSGTAWRRVRTAWSAARPRAASWHPDMVSVALRLAVSADIVRPSFAWLLSGTVGNGSLVRTLAATRGPEGFARLAEHCDRQRDVPAKPRAHTLYRAALVMAAKGGVLGEVTAGDALELFEAEAGTAGGLSWGSAFFYRMLHETGVLGEGAPPTLRQLRTVGQRTPEQLIDRYHLVCRPVRDLLVDYLKERQPALDYNSLTSLANLLGRCFWADLEAHHPGISSLHLSTEVASAWKARLRTVAKKARAATGETTEVVASRLSYRECLTPVRAFYLDLAEWALEGPGRWGPWVAPSPVKQDEGVQRKQARQRKARMDQRARERLPVLPSLVAALDGRRKTAQALLGAACRAQPGEAFAVAGTSFVRQARAGGTWAQDLATSQLRNFAKEEENAFWAWAVVEVLRHSGVRIEELLELTHHSLVEYRLPGTGDLVPLLQVAPSKTDAERLIVVSPELADVLSTVILRTRDRSGALPLVPTYDDYERVWLAPAPRLFQRPVNGEHRGFAHSTVLELLGAAAAETGLTGRADGQPLHWTPHDFRRIFVTDVIMNGLPPHIAQVIAGHQDINVTLGYKAIYPEEAVQSHLAFLARRRCLRPSEEYRTPTDEEWQELLGNFERRKLSVGTCARAFSTPCVHEHACVRCPMLWPDPAQRARLAEISDNLMARISEAEREGWLGEVERLQVSLAGAQDKLAQIDRRLQAQVVTLSPTRAATAD